MPDDSLDNEYLVIGVCITCGEPIFHSPIRMPIGRPMINPEKPGHYGVQYGPMCILCIRKQLDVFSEKVENGEMYPTQAWEQDEQGGFRIVSIAADSIPAAPRIEPPPVNQPPEEIIEDPVEEEEMDEEEEPDERIGLIRLLWRHVVRPIWRLVW